MATAHAPVLWLTNHHAVTADSVPLRESEPSLWPIVSFPDLHENVEVGILHLRSLQPLLQLRLYEATCTLKYFKVLLVVLDT